MTFVDYFTFYGLCFLFWCSTLCAAGCSVYFLLKAFWIID